MDDHLSETELLTRLDEAAKLVAVGSQYRHYKNQLYKVLSLIIIEATNEVGVVYQAQYGAQLTFLRPLSVWLETVSYEGKTLPRFAKV